jgi:hypothetical protein
MPVLKITPAMIGPDRSPLTLAYLGAVMLWPDDLDQRTELIKTARAAYLKNVIGSVPGACDPGAGFDLWEMVFDAIPPRVLMNMGGGSRPVDHGWAAGEYLAKAVQDSAAGRRVKLAAIKAAITAPKRRKSHPRLDFSEDTFVNTIWPRYRPVAHLWAAYVYEGLWEVPGSLFPCDLEHLPDFLALANFFYKVALSIEIRQRRDALMSGTDAWTLPPGLPLPRYELVPITV